MNEASEEEAEQKPEDSSEENILDVQQENVNTLEKIEQLFVKKVAKYKEKEDIFHKNKIEKCLFLKIALIHVQY